MADEQQTPVLDENEEAEEQEEQVVVEDDDDEVVEEEEEEEGTVIEEDEEEDTLFDPMNDDDDDDDDAEQDDTGPPAPPVYPDWSNGEDNSTTLDDDSSVLPPTPPPAGLPKIQPKEIELPSLPKRRPLTVDEDLAEWVQEYLQYRGFTNTLDCFQAEYLSRQYAVTSSQAAHVSSSSSSSSSKQPEASKSDADASATSDSPSESRESVVIRSRREKLNALLTCFDTGDSEGFTKLWFTHIPLYVRQEDTRVQKCYFLARVCFLARCVALDNNSSSVTTNNSSIPRSPVVGSPKKKRSNLLTREMHRFREYLEQEGGDIAGTDRTLERYPALLYVGNPLKHPSFTELFSGAGPIIRDVRHPGRKNGGNRWTLDVREEISSVVDDTLQHVPAPRLLQMYDAFMTSYSSFDVQLRERRVQNERSRLLSKRLYGLSVKMAKDISEKTVPGYDENNTQNKEGKRKYVQNLRRELKECREQINTVTLLNHNSNKNDTTNSNNPTTIDSSFLLGQPPTLDFDKVRRCLDSNDENDTASLLDALWWRMSKTQPPSLKTGMIPDQKMIQLRKDLRRKITLDLCDGDFLCLRKTIQPEGASSKNMLNSLLQNSSENGANVNDRQVSALRVLDALAGWSFGRDYLSLSNQNNSLVELALLVWNMLVKEEVLKKDEIVSDASKEKNQKKYLMRRHGISLLQRLSSMNDVADALSKNIANNNVVVYLSTLLQKGLASKSIDTGTSRFAIALVLNVIVAGQRTNGLASLSKNEYRDLGESICRVMEEKATCENGDDKWGRRYASAALYALCATTSHRDALNYKDVEGEENKSSSGRVKAKLKTLLHKSALNKKHKLFAHEIKHCLLRLETEENNIPPSNSTIGTSDQDVDEDWYSDSEDYLDDVKYNNAVLGAGGPEAAARAR